MVARGRDELSLTSGRPDVLVVGAGPVGLATALHAHAHGATVRVVERRPEAFRPSRAMIVHPRTLESLRPLGVVDALLDRGDRASRAVLHLGGRRVEVQLGDVALGDTPYPHLTLVRQMDVEEVLAAALEKRGVVVERGVKLVGAATEGDGARAWLRTDGESAEVECGYVAGCDGPASTVRSAAAVSWRGGAYGEEVVLADVELEGSLVPGALNVVAGKRGLVFVFALGEGATWRVLATRPVREPAGLFGQPGNEVPLSEVQEILRGAGLDATVTELRWSAEVLLQHRLAGGFRSGRLFLAGDAAHAHSPAAAQGMNTGILDAANLGWKLAFADRAGSDALLDSYEKERRPVARAVLALTHAVFFAEASTHPLPSFLRGHVVPRVAPLAPLVTRQPWVMAQLVKVLSQRWVSYGGSPLSMEGSPGGPGPRPGSRVPDQDVTCAGRPTRLHDLLSSPGVHVLGARDADVPVPASPFVHVHQVGSWPGRGVLAVRPDGHVGYRSGDDAAEPLLDWLTLVGAARLASRSWPRR